MQKAGGEDCRLLFVVLDVIGMRKFPLIGKTFASVMPLNTGETMNFTEIDLETWHRRAYFNHYLEVVPCSYSMTTKLDITKVKQRGLPLYPTMLYLLTKTVHEFEQFRTAFRPDGSLVVYQEMSPSYTVFHQDSETFSNLWTEYTEDYPAFCRRYRQDNSQFGSVEKLFAKPDQPENSFTVSMVPWCSFDSFHLHTEGYRYLLPVFTLGRYQEIGGNYWIPIAVQVHHAVCDGFHVCRFINRLQEFLNEELPAV